MGKRKNFIKYYSVSFLIIVTIIFTIVISYLGSLKTGIEQFVSHYGHSIVFLFSFLSDIIMQPIGPDLMIISGIMVRLNPFLVLIMASAGSVLASFLNYWLGKNMEKLVL